MYLCTKQTNLEFLILLHTCINQLLCQGLVLWRLSGVKKGVQVCSSVSLIYFNPVAIKSFGTLGSQSRPFIRSLGQRIHLYTVDENAGPYLIQCLSVTVQHGNAAFIISLMAPAL